MSQDSVTLRFEIIQDGESVRTEQLDQDVVKIGKLASSHLRLEDANVSRIHAVIEKGSGGTYSVIDLGSAAGTFVNGDKVTKAEISDGDELQFGETVVRVHFVEAGAHTDATAGGEMDFGGEADATVVTEPSEDQLDGDRQAARSAGQHEAAQQPSNTQITLEDGTVVEPYTQQGYYDDHNNYIPYWYDQHGQYHAGYGYYDDQGEWQVAFGYYDPEGEWIATEEPVGFVDSGESDSASYYDGPSDSELYQDEFFESTGGDTLEVALLWSDHVLSVTSFRTPRTVTIGPDEENDFVVEDAAFGQDISFPFVSFRDGSYFLTFNASMSGFVQNGDQQYSFDEAVEQGIARPSSEATGAHEVPLGKQSSARIDVGTTTFLVHFTDMPTVIGGGFKIDTDPIPYLAMSAAAHILLLLLAMTLPDDARSLELDGFEAEDRFVEMMMKPEQEEEEEPDWLDDDGGDEEEAAKHQGEEGEAGKEDEEQDDNQMAVEGPPDNADPEIKKAHDTNVAKNAGVESVFNDDELSSMWGSGSESVGSDAVDAIGNMEGEQTGAAKGFGGLGVAGSGRGGGGVSESGFGMANVGTSGRGGGGRGGSGYGKGAGNLGEKENKLPQVVPGKPAVTGSLDKEIIQRVIRKHRREVAYCYEKELQKNKSLKGRIKVKFTISPTGDVVSAVVSNSTMNDQTVESCVTSKIQRWVFPEPKGGGMVVVNYPFNFSRQ
ncbi:MAG: AgmX/PglI C-terminal domain-containing protein [Persicimonas sp.]